MSVYPRILATVLLASPAFPPAVAQQAESEPLDTITVIATRSERSLEELASTVTVRTADDLERELTQDIADLVRFEPGVTVAGTGSRFGLTGFNIRGIGGNRVLTMIDGVRVPDEFSFGPFLSARRDYVDIDSLSRAEIARGPISSLYGSDALGGVVALTTRHPRDYLDMDRTFSGAFKGGYSGVDSSSTGTLSLAGRAGRSSGMILYTGRTGRETSNAGTEGGHGSGRELPDPQDIDVGNLTAKIAFSPSEAHEFTLGVDAYENETDTQILSDYGIAVFGTRVNSRDARDTRRRNRWTLAYRHTGILPVADSIQVTAYRQDSRSEQLTLEDRTTRTRASQSRRRSSLYEQEIRGAWIQLDKSFDVGAVNNLVTWGADYYVTDNASVRDGGTFDASGSPVREFSPLPTRDFPLTEVTQLAVFLQDEITLLGGDLLLSPSVRFDRFEAATEADGIYLNGNPGTPLPEDYDDSQVTAKLGAVYSFTDAVSAFGRYSEGFRAPPYDDVNVGFTNFLGGYKTIANPALESERSQGIELGLRLRGERGHAQVAVFRNDYEHFIESFAIAPHFLRSGGIDPADRLRTFQSVNRDRVQINGWEFGGAYELGFGLTLRASAAYASGEDRSTGVPLNSIEPLNGVVGLDYDAPGDRWGGNLIVSAASGKDETDIDPADPRHAPSGYGVVDLMGYVNFGARVRLNAGIFNLTDRTYIRWADTAGIGADAPMRFTQPGINAALTLRVEL